MSKLLTDSLFKLRLLFLCEPFFTIMAFDACHATVSYSHQELPQRCLKVLAERWRFAVEIERDEVSQSGILHLWWGFFGLWTAAEEVQSCKPDAVIQRGEGKMESLKSTGAVCTPEGMSTCGPLGAHDTGPRVKVTRNRGVQSRQQSVNSTWKYS